MRWQSRTLLATALGPTGGRKRQLAAVAAGLAVVGGLAVAQGKPDTGGLEVQPIDVEAQPITSFDKNDQGRTRYGRLEWRGGLVLSSSSANFGGWSGLAFDPGGKRLIAVSDAGAWMTAELGYDGRRPNALKSVRIGPLAARDGRALRQRGDRDAEALVLAEGSLAKGTLLIAFEGHDRIGRFPAGARGVSAPVAYLEIPPEIHRLGRNGLEALTVLRGGEFKGSVVAVAEQPLPGERDRAGWIWVGGEPKRFAVEDVGGFDVTDMASLDDGGLLVLERRFNWSEGVKMRLRRVKARALRPGAVVGGEVLVEADSRHEIDNMEGLAVRQGAGGETLITMISDDNFNKVLQRTVLLEFALSGKDTASAATKAHETRSKRAGAR